MWMDGSMDVNVWMVDVCVCVFVCDPVVRKTNPKPNLSAQNTKCTILWSRIWRWQGKQTSGKWIKLHSRIAEFWRILFYLLQNQTITPVEHTIRSCVFVWNLPKPRSPIHREKNKTLWYIANVYMSTRAPNWSTEYDRYTHKHLNAHNVWHNSIKFNWNEWSPFSSPFRSSSIYANTSMLSRGLHYRSAKRNHFQCRNLTTTEQQQQWMEQKNGFDSKLEKIS